MGVFWPAAIKIFKQYPITGTGAILTEEEMERETGSYRPLHNEFLTVLTYTGLAGFVLFLLFFKSLYFLAYDWREKANNPFPLTLLFLILFFLFKAGGGLVQSYVWVIFIMLSIPYNSNGRFKEKIEPKTFEIEANEK